MLLEWVLVKVCNLSYRNKEATLFTLLLNKAILFWAFWDRGMFKVLLQSLEIDIPERSTLP